LRPKAAKRGFHRPGRISAPFCSTFSRSPRGPSSRTRIVFQPRSACRCHEDRYAAELITPTLVRFTAPGTSRDRQVSAYQKSFRPNTGRLQGTTSQQNGVVFEAKKEIPVYRTRLVFLTEGASPSHFGKSGLASKKKTSPKEIGCRMSDVGSWDDKTEILVQGCAL